MSSITAQIIPHESQLGVQTEIPTEIQHRLNRVQKLLWTVGLSSILTAGLILEAGFEENKNAIACEVLATAMIWVAGRKIQQRADGILDTIEDAPTAVRRFGFGTTDLSMAKFGTESTHLSTTMATIGAIMVDVGKTAVDDNGGAVMCVMGGGLILISTIGGCGVLSDSLRDLRTAVANPRNVQLKAEEPAI